MCVLNCDALPLGACTWDLCFAAIGDANGSRVWATVLGVLFAIVALTLLFASWTRWGQTKSLTKCIALAFLAHVWLLMYAYGTRVVMPGLGGGNTGGHPNTSMPLAVSLLDFTSEPTADSGNEPPTDETMESTQRDLDDLQNQDPIEAWQAPIQSESKAPSNQDLAKLLNTPPQAPPEETPVSSLPKAVEPEIPELDADQLLKMANLATTPVVPPPPASATTAISNNSGALHAEPVAKRKLDQQPVPYNYQMRLSPMKAQFAFMNGGDANTEVAVELALEWLARAQSPDGSWNAAQHGAGREPPAGNNRSEAEYRHHAGERANTAMTGLALLAFLGAGHSHVEGKYKENVTAGLRYLISQQLQSSGDLSGRDQVGNEPTVRYARMYSHGMAGLALAEAYAMTGDHQLQTAVAAACQYTLNAMNPNTGGWRYEFWSVNLRTSDPGDTSQFGWQAMLLHSAASNGIITLPMEKRVLMNRFLDSVSLGKHGGLAMYRPRIGTQGMGAEAATPSMTAEALASRLLMRFPLSPLAADEAQRYMLKSLPGQSEENLYYWYYATLALYQLRGDAKDSQNTSVSQQAWTVWNESLKRQLCSTQISHGNLKGSWHPTCVWGSYGGRVYSTAVACMCLEVYYRYLPLYQADQFANHWQPARR